MSGLIKVKIAKVSKGTVRSGGRTSGSISSGASIEFAQRAVYAHYADEADKATQAERAKEADRLTSEAVKDLERAVLSKLFIPYLDTTAKTWADVRKDEDFNSVKIKTSLWTDGFMSARGLNPNGGSGSGGFGKSYLSDLLDVDLGALSSGQVLTWNGTKWVNSALTLPDMAGYALESWVEANFQSKGDYLTIEAASTSFVSKAGDSMTGALNIGNSSPTQIWLNSSGTSETGIGLKVNGATLGWVGYNAYRGTVLYTYDGGHYLGIYSNGTPRFDGNVIWHAGNDGSGSGLDADLLDGKHRTEILRHGYNPTSKTSLDDRYMMSGIDMFSWDFASAPNVAGQPSGDGVKSAACVVSFGTLYPFQIYSDYINTDLLYYRSFQSSTGWKAWRQFAFIDSNVASATKLKTARSIWGQSFDGTGNVSGTMSGVGSIVMNGGIEGTNYIELKSATPYIDFYFNNDSGDYTSRIIESASGQLCINHVIWANYNGNVGIGTSTPTAKLDVAGLVKASSGIQIGSTDGYGWYISHPNLICAGGGIARAVGAGSLLVSNAWADATKVPKNGIYSKGEIISSNINAFRAISGDYGAIIRNDGEHLYFLLTNSKDQYGSYNGLRPLYINLATGLVKMQQGLQIGECTISWDAANNMLKFDKGLYSEGGVSARGINTNAGGSGTSSGDYMKKDASNAGPYAMGNLIVNTQLSQLSMPADDELFICTDGQSGNTLAQKFPMTSLWKYIKTKADSNYATLDNVGLANLMWQVDEITDSIPSDDDMFAVADVGYDYDFCNKYHMSSLWQYIKTKMGLAFTVDGDNVAIGCQPGTLRINGNCTINSSGVISSVGANIGGLVAAYGINLTGPSPQMKITYQGKAYTLQLAKLIKDGYLA